MKLGDRVLALDFWGRPEQPTLCGTIIEFAREDGYPIKVRWDDGTEMIISRKYLSKIEGER